MTRERMTQGFSVFNLHVNKAGKRADREFKAQFGQEAFEKHIAPLRESGIMAIFHDKPTPHTAAWVALVTAYANEKVAYRLTPDGPMPVERKRKAVAR